MRRWPYLIVLALAACSPDPFQRPGTWSLPPGSLGSNDANLRVMIIDPHDLAVGVSAEGSDGFAAAAPVRKLVSGRRAQLPNNNASNLGTIGSQSSQPPGQAGSNGTGEQ